MLCLAMVSHSRPYCHNSKFIKTFKERKLLNFGRRLVLVIGHTEEEVMSPNADPVKSMGSSDFFVGTPEQVLIRDKKRVSSHCRLPPSIASSLFLLLWSVLLDFCFGITPAWRL